MKPAEIAAMSRAVAQHFGLWAKGQMCDYGDVRCRHFDEPLADTWKEFTQGKFKPHGIPCPDLTQPEHFVRLLAIITDKHGVDFCHWYDAKQRCATIRQGGSIWQGTGDTIYTAFLCAAYQLVQREAAK